MNKQLQLQLLTEAGHNICADDTWCTFKCKRCDNVFAPNNISKIYILSKNKLAWKVESTSKTCDDYIIESIIK